MPKNQTFRFITAAAIVLIMAMIFFFSSQDGNKSSRTSGAITDIVIKVSRPDYEKLPVAEKTAVRLRVGHVVRKLGHFTEFALLGAALYIHVLVCRKKRLGRLRTFALHVLLCLLIGAAYAVTDELHQGLISGRAPMATDVLIDSAGVLFGILVVLAIRLIRRPLPPSV